MMQLEDFYIQAFDYVSKNFLEELLWVDERYFENMDSYYFFEEYCFVVLSAGMKNQIVKKIFQKFKETHDVTCIGHLGKRKAIQEAITKYEYWFQTLKQMNNKIAYLETLPFIGPITKYHLARNLEIDCAKPDRHLVRVANFYGFGDVQEFCKFLSNIFGMRIGTVDLVIWRYCNMKGFPPLCNNSASLG